MNDRFMRERPILPLLLSMAIPNMVSMLVSALYNIVDSFFVARISEQAMTALSLVYPVQNLINAVAIGFGVGVGALISLSLGAGDRAAAENAAGKGLLLSTGHGVTATVCSIALMPAFLRMFTQDREVISYGTQYAAIAFSFSVIIMLGMTFEKIFQSVGRMQGAMLSLLCGCIANILLDPLLIFGLDPFPALGIAGAAIATGLGQCITLAVYLLLTRCRPLPIRIGRTRLRSRSAICGCTRSDCLPHSALPCLRCWFPSSMHCSRRIPRSISSSSAATTSCKHFCICLQAARCRGCGRSSAITTAQEKPRASTAFTAMPLASTG